MKESRNLQRQTTAKEVQYDDKVAELKKLQNILKELNKELSLIDDQITLLTSSTASTTVLSSPAAAKSATLNDLEREKADLEEKILDIETYINTTSLSPEISNLASELAILKKDYATKQQENTDKTRDIKDTQREITSKGTEIEQVKENIADNKVGRQMNLNKNKDAIQNYEDTFNLLNRNRNSVKQDPNESDRDYIARIKSLESLPLDKSIYKEKAELEGSRKLMTNLRNVLRDEAKISDTRGVRILYKSYRSPHHDRDEPEAAVCARLDDPREPAAPPASRARRARGGLHHVLLQLARPARGDDRDAPAHDEHGHGGRRGSTEAQHRGEAGGPPPDDGRPEQGVEPDPRAACRRQGAGQGARDGSVRALRQRLPGLLRALRAHVPRHAGDADGARGHRRRDAQERGRVCERVHARAGGERVGQHRLVIQQHSSQVALLHHVARALGRLRGFSRAVWMGCGDGDASIVSR
jgi:hypothetical protein